VLHADQAPIRSARLTQSGTLRRAMAFIDGSDRSDRGMNQPSLRVVQQHLNQFGSGYADRFLAAVPEPQALSILMPLISAGALLGRRRRCR